MCTPQLSVLVANHNHAAVLGECLNSILGQSFRNLEAVVYDDASSDDSAAVVEAYRRKDPRRVRLLPGKKRKGPAYARNQAALAARGRYLTTLDADDIFADYGKLERELSLVARVLEEQGIDAAAFSDVVEESPGGETRLWGDYMKVNEGWIRDHLLARSGFIPRDFVFSRRAFADSGGYDPRLSTHEDWDLKIRLAGVIPFYYTGAPGTVYRRGPAGLSQTGHRRRMRNLWRVYRRHRIHLDSESRRAADQAFRIFMLGREKGSNPLEAAMRRLLCGRIDRFLAPGRQEKRTRQWNINQS